MTYHKTVPSPNRLHTCFLSIEADFIVIIKCRETYRNWLHVNSHNGFLTNTFLQQNDFHCGEHIKYF